MVLSRVDPSEARPPDGFVHLPAFRAGDFNDIAGPWFLKDEGGRLVGGFRVLDHHLNPNGTCHGGMLATFCDVLLPLGAIYQVDALRLMMPTIGLSLDFLEPTPLGAWVEGRVEVLRIGRRVAFLHGLLTAEGRLVVRSNGTFSVPAAEAEGAVLGDALRRLLRGRA